MNLPKELTERLAGQRVEEVECIVPDLFGISRGKAMPWMKFAKEDPVYLPISIFYQTITGDYVSTLVESEWTESDMVLRPDYGTATLAPWAADVTLQVIHDIEEQDGRPVQIAPRNVLKRIIAAYHSNGWQPIVAPEMEFYLTKRNLNPNDPIEPPTGRTGRRMAGRQSYSMAAVDEYGPIIDDIYDFAEAQGFPIDTIIQEGGAGQIEINLAHGDPLQLADRVFFFKRTIREAALRHDCFATFMAKPMEDQPGSAMHLHHSVVDRETGDNIFSNGNEATDQFYAFIAGLQTHIPKVVAIFAPYVNSYRRFVPNTSAPINLEWGRDNRTTGIRVPISDPSSRRVENRIVGMDCNPYLAIAASLACGYLGMTEKLKPRPIYAGAADMLDHELPRGLLTALDDFPEDGPVTELLGKEFCLLFKTIKTQEIEDFLQVISPWERDHLLLNV
jgi:glutamine synthetase